MGRIEKKDRENTPRIGFPSVLFMLVALMAWLFRLQPAFSFDTDAYQAFLERYVTPGRSVDGIALTVVDYDAIHADPAAFYDPVLAGLAAYNPKALETRQEKIAFWINVYNIGAIKMILDHYPVDSIRSRSIHWLKKAI